MRVLRTLASLCGRALQRLGLFLVAWSSRGAGPVETEWAATDDDGPPEHWLRYLRQRSPWLVRNHARGAARATRPPTPEATRETPVGTLRQDPPAPVASIARSIAVRASVPGPASPAPVPPTPPRASAIRQRTNNPADHPAEPGSRATSRAATVVQPPPAPAHDNEHQERLQRHALRVLVTENHHRRHHDGREKALCDSRPSSRDPLTVERPPSVVVRQDKNSPGRVTEAAPAVPLPEIQHRSDLDRNTPEAHSWQHAPRAQLPSELQPKPAIPQGRDPLDGAPRPVPSVSSRWPELPDVRWSEPTWEVPSSQTLVRLQQRLARLQAEQAGSSWSGRPS